MSSPADPTKVFSRIDPPAPVPNGALRYRCSVCSAVLDFHLFNLPQLAKTLEEHPCVKDLHGQTWKKKLTPALMKYIAEIEDLEWNEERADDCMECTRNTLMGALVEQMGINKGMSPNVEENSGISLKQAKNL